MDLRNKDELRAWLDRRPPLFSDNETIRASLPQSWRNFEEQAPRAELHGEFQHSERCMCVECTGPLW